MIQAIKVVLVFFGGIFVVELPKSYWKSNLTFRSKLLKKIYYNSCYWRRCSRLILHVSPSGVAQRKRARQNKLMISHRYGMQMVVCSDL